MPRCSTQNASPVRGVCTTWAGACQGQEGLLLTPCTWKHAPNGCAGEVPASSALARRDQAMMCWHVAAGSAEPTQIGAAVMRNPMRPDPWGQCLGCRRGGGCPCLRARLSGEAARLVRMQHDWALPPAGLAVQRRLVVSHAHAQHQVRQEHPALRKESCLPAHACALAGTRRR